MNFQNIFIVGNGRTGTNFLCRSLLGFANVDDFMDGQENHAVRHQVTLAALHHEPLSKDTMDYYRSHIKKANNQGKIFLDQSHPNLFHVEQLLDDFLKSLFLATDRPIEQVVSSMLRHKSVMGWFDYAKSHTGHRCRFPNQFLGVSTKDHLNKPKHLLCAMRVIAHNKKRQDLIERHPGVVRLIKFTSLVKDQIGTLRDIFTTREFSALGLFEMSLQSEQSVLKKYKENLSDQMLKEILQCQI